MKILFTKIFTKFRISQCPIRDLSRKIKKYFYFSLTRATFLRRHQDSDCVNNYKRFFLAEKKNGADFFSHGQKLKARVEISIRRKFWVRQHHRSLDAGLAKIFRMKNVSSLHPRRRRLSSMMSRSLTVRSPRHFQISIHTYQ